MQKKLSLVLLLFCFFHATSPVAAQKKASFQSAGTEIGVYYYPEHWPEDQWERDIKRMAELGFEFIHLAEFAWSQLEPVEGQYEFDWLDKVVDLAAENQLKVIMCTPSPCVPAWLSTKHPEVLSVDKQGRRVHHNGSRLTASLANPIYQWYVERMVRKLGEKYGQDDRIWGWQIGNEPHIQTVYDYSPSAEKAFRKYVKEKYQTLDALNHAWGGAFWSYEFSAFEEIKIPNETITGTNPHALLDFQLYTAQEIANDINQQADLLRKHTLSGQWITTNYAYFKFLPNVDPFLTRSSLDFSAHTMYLTSNFLNTSGDELAHRLGSGMELSFSKELAASTHGYTGIMELQPGQINWGSLNAIPLPGAVRMWVWHAFGLGDEFICTYRFRQPLYGSEQYHHGIMMTDGVTVNRGGEEFVQALQEIEGIKGELDVNATSEYIQQSKTAFLMSYQNILDMENYKHHEDWDSWQHIYTYYTALKRMGVQVDFVQEDMEWSVAEHPFMVVPAYQIISQAMIAKLQQYVAEGGQLVISTRTGLKDPNGHLWEMKVQEPIWDLIGGEIQVYDHLPAAYPGKISFEDTTYPWHSWGTLLSPQGDTKTWASFSDQFYKDTPAITHKTQGKGSVTYIGAWSDNWDLEYQVLRKLYGQKLSFPLLDLPPYVFATFREGIWVAVNYTAQKQVIDIKKDSKLFFGSKELQPGQVVVWKEK
ncbi:MAG: beta-galactosidase [Saprospiraceae bacterium]|nr:beta-galactosidase [Saprospiraceae bacterium]